MIRLLFFSLVVFLPLLATTAAADTTDLKIGTTLENLQTAFNGESNAHARYLAFAKQADLEGYGKAASLFRAAARAEEIHANNHARVIKKLGGVPQAKIDAPVVRSTRENIDAAVQGETYERDVMYPAFIRQARAENDYQAIETFNLARTAEAEHARLYTAALNKLPDMKGAGQTMYVCPVCGYTTEKPDFANCPSCFTPREKFEQVS